MDSMVDFVIASVLLTIVFCGLWVLLSIGLDNTLKKLINKIGANNRTGASYKQRNTARLIKSASFYIVPLVVIPLMWSYFHRTYVRNRDHINTYDSIIHKNSGDTFNVKNIGNDIIRVYDGEVSKKIARYSWTYSDIEAGKVADTGQLSLRKMSQTEDQNDKICSGDKCSPFDETKIVYDRSHDRFDVWNKSDHEIRIESENGRLILNVKPDHYAVKAVNNDN